MHRPVRTIPSEERAEEAARAPASESRTDSHEPRTDALDARAHALGHQGGALDQRLDPLGHSPVALDPRVRPLGQASRSAPIAVHGDTARRAASRAGWFIPPTFLAATATGVLLVLRGPDRYFGLALGLLLALSVLWILVSVLFPGSVERTCPRCGEESLQPLDSSSTRGVVCAECDHVDPDQSSFMMAEEEGSLGAIVIAERERSRAAPSSRARPRS
jgi:hypothetical protein